jgi:Protein of unknown function (DUF1997)
MKTNGMDTSFRAKQSVDIAIPEGPMLIQPYLQQSIRIVNALTSLDRPSLDHKGASSQAPSSQAPSSQVEILGGDLFRLKLRPLKFLALTLQPIVDMRVWTAADDVLHVQSVACEILGLEQFNNPPFELDLIGELYPLAVRGKMHLRGQIALTVKAEMPMPIALTPKPVLEATGNAIMLGVLTTMKQRLLKNLIADYRDWVNTQQRSVLTAH